MSIEISIEDAYAEAAKIIGEQSVTLRFLQAELDRVRTERDALQGHLARRDEPTT